MLLKNGNQYILHLDYPHLLSILRYQLQLDSLKLQIGQFGPPQDFQLDLKTQFLVRCTHNYSDPP